MGEDYGLYNVVKISVVVVFGELGVKEFVRHKEEYHYSHRT